MTSMMIASLVVGGIGVSIAGAGLFIWSGSRAVRDKVIEPRMRQLVQARIDQGIGWMIFGGACILGAIAKGAGL